MNALRVCPKKLSYNHQPCIQSFSFSSSTTTTSRSHGKARTRRSSSPKNKKSSSWFQESSIPQIPSLKEFLHRQTVLHQYRSFLKAISKFSSPKDALEARREVQHLFRMHQFETNALTVKMVLTDGQRRLAQVQSLVGHPPKPILSSPSSSPSSSSNNKDEEEDEDSWLNIKDDLDKRGRVGEEWPWERTTEDENNDEKKE